MTHLTLKLSLKISNPSNFYHKLGSSNPKLWVFEPQHIGLEVEAWDPEMKRSGRELNRFSSLLRRFSNLLKYFVQILQRFGLEVNRSSREVQRFGIIAE
jgi:hypothetical protein